MADRIKALELMQKSGIVNTKISLGEIMETAGRLEALNPGELAGWTLLSKDYLYTGAAMEDLGQKVTGQR